MSASLKEDCTSCSIYSQMEQYRQRLRHQLLIDLQNLQPLHGETLQELGEYYGYEFTAGALNILLLNIIPRFSDETGSQRRAALFQAEAFLQARLLPLFPEGALCVTKDFLLCLVNIPFAPHSPDVSRFKQQFSQCFDLLCRDPILSTFHLIMGEGIPCRDTAGLYDCFRSAVDAIEHGIMGGYNKCYDSNSLNPSPTSAPTLNAPQLSRLQAGLVRRDAELLSQWVQDVFQEFHPMFECTPTLAFTLPREIMQSACTLCRSLPGSELLQHAGDRLAHCVTLEQEQAVLINTFQQFCSVNGPKLSPGVSQVQAYLALHFREAVSLDQLGAIANLNPQYLSVLFRQETGQTISQHIQTLRLSAAQELLKDSSLSISQIAAAVGYHDSRYFSRIFQKALKQTPSAYRSSQFNAY